MNITVFTDSKPVKTAFEKIEKNKAYSVAFFPVGDLKKEIKKLPPRSLLYVDLGALAAPEQKKTLTFLEKQDDHMVGVIDSKGSIPDMAEAFHRGSCDFIGKGLLKNPLDVKRLKGVLEYGEKLLPEVEEETKTAAQRDYILSGDSWKGIKAGNEYTFCFMFIEMDNQKELKRSFGAQNLEKVITEFHDYVASLVAPLMGKIWMWMDFGGLILFPFDGEKCDVILAGIKLMMYRGIFSVEDFDYDMIFSFRIALHIGNTVYEIRGDTGELVSDSINSIFHLGQKYAKPGNLYLTENMMEHVPHGLEKSFLDDGIYEGREIFRMRQLQ